jgi:hypothetical protein
LSENNLDKNSKKSKDNIEIVENSRNMDLCLLNLENNKFNISVTDTIDETSIFSFVINNEDNNNTNIDDNIIINKKIIKFTSSNFIPLCICYCSDKYLLYGQSNGILRIYSNNNGEEKYFKLHEAGINEIKIFNVSISKNIFLIFTCGEDCNLAISEFDINKKEINIVNKINNLHYSAIKSVDIIKYENNLIILTGSYDQIVTVSLFSLTNYIFKVLKKFQVCTSEINSIKGKLIHNEKNSDSFLYIIIGGLGMELLKFKIQE